MRSEICSHFIPYKFHIIIVRYIYLFYLLFRYKPVWHMYRITLTISSHVARKPAEFNVAFLSFSCYYIVYDVSYYICWAAFLYAVL